MVNLYFKGSESTYSGTSLFFINGVSNASSAGVSDNILTSLNYSNGSTGASAKYVTLNFSLSGEDKSILESIEFWGLDASSTQVPLGTITGLHMEVNFPYSTIFTPSEKIEFIQLLQNLFSGNDNIFMTGRVSYVYGDYYTVSTSGPVHAGNDVITLNYTTLPSGYSNTTVVGDAFVTAAGTDFYAGDDTISVNTSAPVRIYGDVQSIAGTIHYGNDRIYSISSNAIIYGDGPDVNATEGGNDFISGSGTLYGGGGNDILRGRYGGDVLNGGEGFDIASYDAPYVYSGTQIVDMATPGLNTGAAAGDTYYSIEALIGRDNVSYADDLRGDDLDNRFWGLAGNDTIAGRGGDDTISGGEGADALDGGTGANTLDYHSSSAGVTVDLLNQTVTGGDATGDTITNFVHALGSNSGDRLTGNAASNFLRGFSGNDVLSGLAGADTLVGDDGNDVLSGGAGGDRLYGGSGIDTLDYRSSGSGVKVDLLHQKVSGGDATGDHISSFENALGSLYRDQLSGSNGDNVLRGYGNNDTLSGLAGNDVIRGDNGDDKLYGGNGHDRLYGGSGNDMIRGGAGADELWGGSGKDVFVFGSLKDSPAKTSARDTIYDFTSKDTLDLHLIDASTKSGGNQKFDFIGQDHFSGHAGELRYVKGASDTYVYADVNGDKKVDFAIHLDDAVTLHGSDFIL